MEKYIQIYCKNIDEYIEAQGGETLAEVYERLKERIAIKPVCAHVNNKTRGLSFPIFKPNYVEFIGTESPSGQRLYVRSLCMVLCKAAHDLFPEWRLRIEHSISKGYYCIPDGTSPSEQEVAQIKTRMQELTAADLPLIYHQKLTADATALLRRSGLKGTADVLDARNELYADYYELDGYFDSCYSALAPSTGYVRVFDLVKYKEGMLLLPPDFENNPSAPATPVEQEKMYHAFTDNIRFDQIIGVSNVSELNAVVDNDEASQLINVAETLHDKEIGHIADRITDSFHEGGARVVLVAGPSSSGKTTTTKRLSIHLLANLIRPQMISLDNYFVNREDTPRDKNGDYDYESIHALDIAQFNADLNDLIAGKEVKMPTYDFATGRRVYRGNTLQLTENSILLMEGIHGLNPELTAGIPDRQKFRVYVSALTTLSIDDHTWIPTTDNRLLRRIIRDYKYRGASALDTISRWQSVRRGEDKWIFPYQENADAMFNSSLLFELGVMKSFAVPILKKVPHNVPQYAEAHRLLTFLSYFREISDSQIPSTSLLREFLGGSSFHY